MPADALTFAVVMPALLVAHNVADHWIQTDHQAGHKGASGWPGRIACAKHVATYTATTAATVALLWWLFALPIAWPWMVAGQMVSAATHYWADRRFTLAKLCERTWVRGFYRLGQPRETVAVLNDKSSYVKLYEGGTEGPVEWDNPSLGTGAYALDQSWHWAWLFVAAVLTSL